jgi:hypothetical protein
MLNEDLTLLRSARWDRLATACLVASFLAMPVTRSVQFPIVGPRLTLFEMLIAPAILAWVAARFTSRSWKTVSITPWLDFPLLAFLGVGLLSGVTAYRTLGSMVLVTFSTEWLIFVYLVAFFFMLRDLLVRRQIMGMILHAWAAAAIVVGVVGLIGINELIRCSLPLSSLIYAEGRLLSTFRNPNQLAAYMVPTILVLASLCATPSQTRLRQMSMLAALLSLVVLFFSASRGAGIAMVAGALLLVALQPTSRRLLWTVALGVLLLGAMAVFSLQAYANGVKCFAYIGSTLPEVTTRLGTSLKDAQGMLDLKKGGAAPPDSPRSATSASLGPDTGKTVPKSAYIPSLDITIPLGGDTATSVAFRAVMARVALRFLFQHPLFGVGIGTMHVHVMELSNHQADVDTHNMVMTMLAETGFIGASLFAWCIGWFLWRAFHSFRKASVDAKPFLAGLFVALVALLVMTLTFDGQRQRALWTLFAVIYAASQPGTLRIFTHSSSND